MNCRAPRRQRRTEGPWHVERHIDAQASWRGDRPKHGAWPAKIRGPFIGQAPFSQSMRGIELAHGVSGLARGIVCLAQVINVFVNFRLQGIGSA